MTWTVQDSLGGLSNYCPVVTNVCEVNVTFTNLLVKPQPFKSKHRAILTLIIHQDNKLFHRYSEFRWGKVQRAATESGV